MTILDRISLVTDNFTEGDRIEVLYKVGEDDTIFISDGNISDMNLYAQQYNESGKITGVNPDGVPIEIVDFKLIK